MLRDAVVTILNTAFTENTADFNGGAISTLNCIIGNRAGAAGGGGIYASQANPTLQNSILWGNRADTGTTETQQSYNYPANGFRLLYSNIGGVGSRPGFILRQPEPTRLPRSLCETRFRSTVDLTAAKEP